MLSKNPVLPNFAKVLCFAAAALVGSNAFAGDKNKAEEKIGDLKEMSSTADQPAELKKHKMKKNKGDLSHEEMKAKMDKAAKAEKNKDVDAAMPE